MLYLIERDGVMAWSVKCLPPKHWDLSLNPSTKVTREGGYSGVCLQSQHWGGKGRRLSSPPNPAKVEPQVQ